MSREHKTKGKSKLLERGVLRQRGRNAGAEEAGVESDAPTCWSSALDPELYGAKERARKGRETTKKMKKSGRNEKNGERFDFEPGKEEDIPTAGSSPAKKGASQIHKLSESLFKHWEDLLESRESFKRRIDTIAAVHGWEGASARRGLLGGVEPGSLLESIQAEAAALKPASKEVEKMGLLLELEALKKQLKAAGEEKDRLEDDLQSSREEVFQARDQLAGQHAQLETLLREVEASGRVTGADAAEKGSASQQGDRMGSALRGAAANADSEASDPLAVFKLALSREQAAEGRRVVEALERLKVPDESIMGAAELACWRENKKTIMNSLKTLSSQIYSATTRILYEIIQNADDCSFEQENESADGGDGGQRAVRELLLECSDEALIAYHNERGFQPKDLYAMCQVGESSKAPGSGKIGRKGIGFKSVFQISDRPLVLSPPFQFCFDTVKHQVFGYIVPSWVESPEDYVPEKQRPHLARIFRPEGPSGTGTLLVCPIAARVRGLDLMRDLAFDGLSLAFLKNLEKITFISSVSRGGVREDGERRELVYSLQQAEEDAGGLQGLADVVLKGVSVVKHQLYQCCIIQRENGHETRRHYRLHTYTILKYKDAGSKAGDHGVPGAAAGRPVTTKISLAFPVDFSHSPLRSEDGELIFAYLPVCAAGFPFAINADFELVASRQDVSDSDSGNHVLLGRIPPLFVHAILTDPVLGEDAFATYLPDVEAIRKDRSGGGRKWRTLASALHRETGTWMMIPTEDEPERVKRKHVVLRPKHLSQALVPNSLLKDVTGKLECGEQSFAHHQAVVDMALESCIDVCPVSVVLKCIAQVLEPFEEVRLSGLQSEVDHGEAKKRHSMRKPFQEKVVNVGSSNSQGEHLRQHTDRDAAAAISEELITAIWRYLCGEIGACLQQGEAGASSLRLIVDAVVGGMDSSQHSFRIFPVRGAKRLRLHSEHGVPLSTGLALSLTAQGRSVVRLAERVVPLLDEARLRGVEGVAETMKFLRIGEAAEAELDGSLRTCFRFGMGSAAADPQLWWNAFRYALARGFPHGLVDLMPPGGAIGLPVTNGVVSSRDAQRLAVGLPCLLGLCRKPRSSKQLLVIPPSVSSWSARLQWELALVKNFGVTYPKYDVERLPAAAFVTDLFYSVAEAREAGNAKALEALGELLDIYETRMSGQLQFLRAAAQASPRLEECLFEKRPDSQRPFSSACSNYFVDEVLQHCNVELADDSYFAVRDVLESSLGMLRLRPVGVRRSAAEGAPDGAHVTPHFGGEDDRPSDSDYESAEEEGFQATMTEWMGGTEALKHRMQNGGESSSGASAAGEEDDGHVEVDEEVDEDESCEAEEVCDELTWEVLQRLLGFYHTFELRDAALLLYSFLTPALLLPAPAHDSPVPTLLPLATGIKHFLHVLELGTIMACVRSHFDVANDLWPLICEHGGVWRGGDFVPLEGCIWRSEGGEVGDVLAECGCTAGKVRAMEAMLTESLEEMEEMYGDGDDSCLGLAQGRSAFVAAMRSCCIKGAAKRHAAGGLRFPPLPYPTDLEMMLSNSLPMLLLREFQEAEVRELHKAEDHQFCPQILACYRALVNKLYQGGFPAVHRWYIPVPSEHLETRRVVVDRALNRQLARDLDSLILLPTVTTPTASSFVKAHFGDDCLHPGLVDIFAPVAEKQSVGFETPCARVERCFKPCLRLALQGSQDKGSHDELWALISELQGSNPARLADEDKWELLMFSAITCAKEWYQVHEDPLLHASQFQETVERVKRLVAFPRRSRAGTSWGLLAQGPSAPGEDGSARGMLLLRTLFSQELWGTLTAAQLLERECSFPVDLPSSILLSANRLQPATPAANSPGDFGRASLVLIYEWFLIEVAGAAPPALMWSTLQEPIMALARPRIRQAEAALRTQLNSSGNSSLCLRLLDHLCEQTQMRTIMDEMDARDEARAAEAAREAEARRMQREAAQARRREEEAAAAAAQARRREEAEAEALARRRERQEELQRQQDERQERRAASQAHGSMGPAAQAPPPRSPAAPPPAPYLPPAHLPQTAAVAGPRREEMQLPQGEVEMRDMIQGLQEEINRMRRERQPALLGGMANTLALLFSAEQAVMGAAGGGDGGGGGGGVPRTRPRVNQTMRGSEVKGKLARFLAGIRAYDRQQAGSRAQDGVAAGQQQHQQQPLPPLLAEFVAWAGDLLAGEQQQGGGDGGGGDNLQRGNGGASRVEEAARRYIAGSRATLQAADDGEEEENCCICLEVLSDGSVHDCLGEPLETACGHRFHAVCYAKTMETRQDPTCPICRSDNFCTLRFL